uniref:Retrotransposon protein, putative, unclassified n=1 Tax=Oryza sativa subsp. japonica TaxID=39947 RepID=Q2R4N1_ORYSJ|nr:retrotransposon protein, putative, unclassified [Oryza sativa Japonica Group]
MASAPLPQAAQLGYKPNVFSFWIFFLQLRLIDYCKNEHMTYSISHTANMQVHKDTKGWHNIGSFAKAAFSKTFKRSPTILNNHTRLYRSNSKPGAKQIITRKRGLLRQRVGFTVDRVHRNGLRNGRSRSTLSTTNGRDQLDLPRFTGQGDDDVSGDVSDDVITDDGSASRARRRTTARRRKRRTPTGRGQHGELTGDQNHGGRATDGAGDEEEAAAVFGSTVTAVLRRSSAAAKRWTGMATTSRSRWWRRRPTTAAATAAQRGSTDGNDSDG